MLGAALLGLLAGCAPDAPHDNPYDVPQTGVYGTTYARNGGALPGVVVTASPANITASSDGQGQFSMELPPSSTQVLQFSKIGRQAVADTVTVPDRGVLQHNVILYGLPTVDTAIVKTIVQRLFNGSQTYSVQPCLVVSHPDGRAYLDDYSYSCQIDTNHWTLAETGSRDEFTKIYAQTIDHVPGVGDFHGYIVGQLARFMVSSSSYSSLTGNRVIPAFLEPAPDNLIPSSGTSFTPPDTLRWTNGRSDVDVRVEVWRGTTFLWAKDTTNISQLLLDTTLGTGNYTWKVIAHDLVGDQAIAEATFTRPISTRR